MDTQIITTESAKLAHKFTTLFERRSSARSTKTLVARAMDGRSDLIVKNLSMTGMLAVSTDVRMPGSLFKFELTIPKQGETIQLWAKVLGLTPAEEGKVGHKIQFCYLSPKATMVLYRHLDATRHLWN